MHSNASVIIHSSFILEHRVQVDKGAKLYAA